MAHEFSGFTIDGTLPDELYGFHRLAEDCRRFCFAIVTRLGSQIANATWNAGWEQRGGRDYFFENAELRIRGRKDPAFLGFFHYKTPERFAGSHWQVWEWEHDDNPVQAIELSVLVADVNAALSSGHIGDYLDARAAEIRSELGLQ